MQSVCSIHGRPRPTRMSNTLLPMELEMAMSPIPETTGRSEVTDCQGGWETNPECVCVCVWFCVYLVEPL